ncbi:MAG: hypothetical protein IKT56_04810 [Clostridia bacterium]|nr:hypothetical protein [Clostridia bacterium]
MSKEAILDIKSTEEQAAKIIEEALENSKRMIANAEKQARQLLEETERSTGKELAIALDKMREKADGLIAKNLEEAEAEATELLAKAEVKKCVAVKKIVWEILENGSN